MALTAKMAIISFAPKNLRLDPVTDPPIHFESPYRPFWIFEVLIEGTIESKLHFDKVAGSKWMASV